MTTADALLDAPAWRLAARQAAVRNRYQRAMVLRFPDLAKHLCDPPLGLKDPQQWSGYIPGYWEAAGERGHMRPNTSPIRAQLAAILQAAAERSDQQATGAELGTAELTQRPVAAISPPWSTR
ncbi:MAG TPA: hypothetical protein VIN75_26840 [Burkholderiaceae bacterium]